MNEASQVQALYRAALHRLAAKASEYEAKDNGQGRKMRKLIEAALADTDTQVAELLEHERLRRR